MRAKNHAVWQSLDSMCLNLSVTKCFTDALSKRICMCMLGGRIRESAELAWLEKKAPLGNTGRMLPFLSPSIYHFIEDLSFLFLSSFGNGHLGSSESQTMLALMQKSLVEQR